MDRAYSRHYNGNILFFITNLMKTYNIYVENLLIKLFALKNFKINSHSRHCKRRCIVSSAELSLHAMLSLININNVIYALTSSFLRMGSSCFPFFLPLPSSSVSSSPSESLSSSLISSRALFFRLRRVGCVVFSLMSSSPSLSSTSSSFQEKRKKTSKETREKDK